MNNKGFVLMLAGVVALGAVIGGAFVGGIALGKSQEAEAGQSSQTSEPASGLGENSVTQSNQQALSDLRARLQSGEATEEELAELRQRFQDGFGSGTGGENFGGRAGLTGTIESVSENTVMITTPQGPLRATIGEDTLIQRLAEVTVADLLEGTRVTVIGQPGDSGGVEARSILIVPEGDGLFGESFFGGRQREGRSP